MRSCRGLSENRHDGMFCYIADNEVNKGDLGMSTFSWLLTSCLKQSVRQSERSSLASPSPPVALHSYHPEAQRMYIYALPQIQHTLMIFYIQQHPCCFCLRVCMSCRHFSVWRTCQCRILVCTSLASSAPGIQVPTNTCRNLFSLPTRRRPGSAAETGGGSVIIDSSGEAIDCRIF